MTTVVITDNKVFADGQMTGGMISSYETKKIINLGNAIVVGAGRWAHVVKFQQWVADTLHAEEVQEMHPHVFVNMPEKMVADDFQGAILYPDGRVVVFEGCDNSFEAKQPVFLGSGSDVAAGSLFSCDDGKKAIEAAIFYDCYTGGEIQIEGFETPVELTEDYLAELDKEQLISFIQTGELPEEGSGYEEEIKPWLKEFTSHHEDLFLNIDNEGYINFGNGNYKNFQLVLDIEDYPKDFYLEMAAMLEVKHAHNISIEKLVTRLDNKIAEIVAELNK